jgi:hypothetical protein
MGKHTLRAGRKFHNKNTKAAKRQKTTANGHELTPINPRKGQPQMDVDERGGKA